MRGLTEKIFSLFNFAAGTSIMLTYIDEDGDSVALVDDNDLCNMAKQSLNPLRITVELNVQKTGAVPLVQCVPMLHGPVIPFNPIRRKLPFFRNSTLDLFAVDISRTKLVFQCPNHEVPEILETAPKIARDRLKKLWTESKDRDWSEVSMVIKVISSDQETVDFSDMAPPGSSTSSEASRRCWTLYVI